MIKKHGDAGYRQIISGIDMKPLVFGEKTLLCKFHLKKGSLIPRHSHPNEQTGYMISGLMRFTIGDETFDAGPGDSWCIPADLEHNAELLEDSVVIEVFSPVRDDYMPKK